jgi:TRAP-type mannitol/chloroaromatic compound transport system permease large subunit
VTAGGTLGILIPPSVLLILYGATAGVSVVQLYAGAFLPGFMLTGLYIGYVIISAKLQPSVAPPLSEEDQCVYLPQFAQVICRTKSENVLSGLIRAIKGKPNPELPRRTLVNHLIIALLPLVAVVLLTVPIYYLVTFPETVDTQGLQVMGAAAEQERTSAEEQALTAAEKGGLQEPESAEELTQPQTETGDLEESEGVGEAKEPQAKAGEEARVAAAPAAEGAKTPPAVAKPAPEAKATAEAKPGRTPAPLGYWITLAVLAAGVVLFYFFFTFERLEIFKLLLGSFFPLALIILGVLGTIVLGLATPTEAAAMGSFGGFVLAAAYKQLNFSVVKESVFLTAKTSAMVCWLFVGSSLFAAAFALLGGQEVVNKFVLSLDLTPTQFMLMAQIIIFLLGWPLEWTEIIVIFMPIFIPLLPHFNIDPLFFGLLVALNLQTAFLSPPVAMAAFYLKGVAPPHVTLNQIFIGMMPFMMIQCLAILLLYLFPQIGLWIPSMVYK